jgi:hypothetical protein
MRIRLGVVLVNFFPRSFLSVECSVLCMFCLGRLAWHLAGLANKSSSDWCIGGALFAYHFVGINLGWIALSGSVVRLSTGIVSCIGRAT